MAKTDESPKLNRHVTIALNHLAKRRGTLVEQNAKITNELEEVNAAIAALEGKVDDVQS